MQREAGPTWFAVLKELWWRKVAILDACPCAVVVHANCGEPTVSAVRRVATASECSYVGGISLEAIASKVRGIDRAAHAATREVERERSAVAKCNCSRWLIRCRSKQYRQPDYCERKPSSHGLTPFCHVASWLPAKVRMAYYTRFLNADEFTHQKWHRFQIVPDPMVNWPPG